MGAQTAATPRRGASPEVLRRTTDGRVVGVRTAVGAAGAAVVGASGADGGGCGGSSGGDGAAVATATPRPDVSPVSVPPPASAASGRRTGAAARGVAEWAAEAARAVARVASAERDKRTALYETRSDMRAVMADLEACERAAALDARREWAAIAARLKGIKVGVPGRINVQCNLCLCCCMYLLTIFVSDDVLCCVCVCVCVCAWLCACPGCLSQYRCAESRVRSRGRRVSLSLE